MPCSTKSCAAKPTAHAAPPRTLILGWGNELRGDDGAGPAVLDRLAAAACAGVALLTVTQLTPELALELAEVDRVVFVDASPLAAARPVRLLPLAPRHNGRGAMGHHLDPAMLLALTAALYGRAPAAWLVAVPAVQFDVGAPFSADTAQGVADAVAAITAWLAQPCRTEHAQQVVFSNDAGAPLAALASA